VDWLLTHIPNRIDLNFVSLLAVSVDRRKRGFVSVERGGCFIKALQPIDNLERLNDGGWPMSKSLPDEIDPKRRVPLVFVTIRFAADVAKQIITKLRYGDRGS
jgi:hypothetical protein